MSTTQFQLDREVSDELRGVIEDSVEYICNEYMISGQLAWLVVETLAEAKIAEFKANDL